EAGQRRADGVVLGRALEVGFEADDPARGSLPIVPELSAAQASLWGDRGAGLRGAKDHTRYRLINLTAVVAEAEAGVAADIESGPGIDLRRNDGHLIVGAEWPGRRTEPIVHAGPDNVVVDAARRTKHER